MDIEQLPDNIKNKYFSPDLLLKKYFLKEFKNLNIDLDDEQILNIITSIHSSEKKVNVDFSDIQTRKAGYKNEEELNKDIFPIFNIKLKSFLEKELENSKNNKTQIGDEIYEEIQKESDLISDENMESILDEPFLYIQDVQNQKTEFLEKNDLMWGYVLDLLESLISMSEETIKNFYNENRKYFESNNYLNYSLIKLTTRAIQVSKEILILLRHGFASGANARWRTLYEICAVSSFLIDKGDNVTAKKYLDFSIIESLRKEKINEDNEAIKLLQNEVDSLVKKYGEPYKIGDFGWAASILNQKKVTFFDIEKSINFSNMRLIYKNACDDIHSGSLRLFYQLGLKNDEQDLLSGSSNLGISEPCHFTSITLNVIISNLILKEPPSIEYLSNAKLYLKLQQEIDTILENIELKLLNDGAT
ncbi:MAG: DUF5677 domain-containing protein [Aliarcobacter sp.]|nr:DUF5677 domain-containing protein [Aliarcobacter sp.]